MSVCYHLARVFGYGAICRMLNSAMRVGVCAMGRVLCNGGDVLCIYFGRMSALVTVEAARKGG